MKLALVFLTLTMFATPVLAQDCSIGTYSNPAGLLYDSFPTPEEINSFWVLLFAEDTAAAAAYSISIPGDVYVQRRYFGPSGDGLVIDEPTGTNVALAECAIGFGGLPVIVTEYQYVVFPGFCCAFITLGPNTSQDPEFPQYVTCSDVKKDCEVGPSLYIGHGDPVEETSFSAVKSLFNH